MLKTRIFEEYTNLQTQRVQDIRKTPNDIIDHYQGLLKRIEIISEPLTERMQRVQRHAYRGIGFMYLIQKQSALAKRYFAQARTLKRLNQTLKYYPLQSMSAHLEA
jgi:hypothetical protein